MSPTRRCILASLLLGAALGTLGRTGGPQEAAALAQATPTPHVATPLPSPGRQPEGTPAAGTGARLYLRDCAWCHGSAGEGTVYGPPLEGVGAASADFMLSTGRMPIPRPDVQPERGDVPYTAREIEALVDHVATFGPGPAIPAVQPEAGSIDEGAELYEIHCAACHGSTGAGGAMTSGLTAPPLAQSTPVQVAEAIRLGGAGLYSGNMPRFGPETLTDSQVDSIVRYVEYLRDPADRGGHPLGRLGPIPEGFVTWAIGLLSIVLLTRWIGDTTR